ncbi:MAG: hypothetical protein Q9161_009193, partial [Pseudevernia consocians]
DEHTRKDMVDFVHREVYSAIQDRRMLNGNVPDDLQKGLQNVLIAGAREMFIWVVRQIENLCRMKTEADIKSAMRALPTKTLNELYEEDFALLSQTGQHSRGYATQVFSMLLCMQEALSPETLIQALAKTISLQGEEMTITKMIDICSNLVVWDSELNVLRFAHMSFQEFLEKTRDEFARRNVHRVAAMNCLDSCLQGSPREIETNLSPKDNFDHYSAVYWAEHCRIAIDSGNDDLIRMKMLEFVFDEGDTALSFFDWLQAVNNFSKKLPNYHALAKDLDSVINSRDSPLFTACVFGLAPIIDELEHMTEYDWNQANNLGQSGLYLAAAAGHVTIVQCLLQHEVYINAFGGNFGHALHTACFHGHESIVECLLEHGADPKVGARSALDYALLGDHENIALLLLDGKFDVSDQSEYDSTLQQAAEAGFSGVVKLLQKKYAPLYGDLGSSTCSAVELAIFRGRIPVVERRMQKTSGPRVDMPKGAIATAALGGQNKMISLLVDYGMDLNEEGVYGTPLRAASIMCHESTVRLLLRLGASLHILGSSGGPLQAAAMRGHESITRTLLSHGANVNSKGGLYGTALQAAAHRGHQKIVEVLLDAGADVYEDGFSRDTLHAASEGGHEKIVRFLLERGFKYGEKYGRVISHMMRRVREASKNLLRDASPSRLRETKPPWDNQPESEDWHERASVTESSQVIDKLRGAVSRQLELIQPYRERHMERDENYALCAAAANGHATVVELLLKHRETMNISKNEIGAAFVEACKNGHVTMIELLLNELDTMDISKSKIGATFVAACKHWQEEVGNLLLSDGLKLEIVRASLSAVALEGHSEEGDLPISRQCQSLVVQRCAAAISRYFFGQALTTAAANRQFDVMKELLENNSDFGIEDLTKTLKSVCAWGNEETLEVFLKYDTKKKLGIYQFARGLSEAVLKNNRSAVVYWLEKHAEHHNLVIDPATVMDVSGNGLIDILPPLVKKFKSMYPFETTLNQSLQAASTMGHGEVIEYLIREGADVNAVIEEALWASGEERCNGKKVTRKLSALQAALIGFKRFAPKYHNRYAPGFESGWQGADASSQERCIEILLANGADPNRADGYERYPLNIAATYGTVETVKKLISSGAYAETSTKDYGTALQAAASRELGTSSIIRVLLNACRPRSSVDFNIAAALENALSFFGTFDGFEHSTSVKDVLSTGPGAVVKLLLANLPEQKTDDYRYGLLAQMACMAGDQDCVELLLQHGMDVNGTFSDQDCIETLSQHSMESNSSASDQHCVETLSQHGMESNSSSSDQDYVESRSPYRMTVSYDHYGTVLQAASRVGNVKIVECLFKAGADVNILQGVHGTALRAAVIGGHEELVHSLIARGADINLCHEDGRVESVLHLALKSSKPQIFKALLVAGADINNPHQQHILIRVCKIGDAKFVEHLLGSGVDINVSETNECHDPYTEANPLNAACAGGHLSVVRLLLNYGADIEKTNKSSVTPLMAAVRGNNPSVVRLLLEAGANVNHATHVTLSWRSDLPHDRSIKPIENATALSEAAEKGNLEIVEELLSAGAIIGRSSIESNALMKACRSRHRMIFELLLEILPGTRYETEVYSEAFSAAMDCGSDEMACLLLEHGMPPSFEMLRQACAVEALETVRFLVDTGVEVNEDDGNDAPLLHVAASHSNPELVQFLINRGANVMLRSARYGSPLIAALEGIAAPDLRSRSQSESCRSLADQLPLPRSMWRRRRILGFEEISQCEQIVRSLFEAGAEMDTSIRSFGNALHLASYMGSEVVVRHLLERMEDVNIFGGYFESPLIAGLKGNHARIVELLLNRDIDVNRHSPEHGSALHEACAHGKKKLIQTLLDYGADVSAYDDNHGSVLAVAASPGLDPWEFGEIENEIEKNRAIVELLLRHEPKIQIRDSDLLAAASWMVKFSFGGVYASSFLDVLSDYGKTVEFTPKFRENLDERLHGMDEMHTYLWLGKQTSEKEFRELFYRLERSTT